MSTVIIDDPEAPARQHIGEHYDLLSTSYGPMLVNTHDPTLETNLGENRKEIEGLLPFCRDGVVADVGANVGSHSINFSRVATLVYAFEPHPHTFYNLCANLLLNSAWNVYPYQCALGNYDGGGLVWNIDPTQPNTGMGITLNAEGASLPVKVVRLDSLGLDRLDFVKIDVEGHELEVLRGGRETLARLLPVVFVEVHHEALLPPILALMGEVGYTGAKEFIRTVFCKSSFATQGWLFFSVPQNR